MGAKRLWGKPWKKGIVSTEGKGKGKGEGAKGVEILGGGDDDDDDMDEDEEDGGVLLRVRSQTIGPKAKNTTPVRWLRRLLVIMG